MSLRTDLAALPTPNALTTTPAHRFLLARAEKRLTSHIAHHGIDQAALELCAMYERMEAANVSGVVRDDLLAFVKVVAA